MSLASWLLLLTGAPLGADAPPLDPAELDRIEARAERLDALLPLWRAEGGWLVGRDDPDYPRRLRRRLDRTAPAMLWGRGDPALVGRGGVAVMAGAAAADPIDAVPGATLIRAGQGTIRLVPEGSGKAAELRLSPPELPPVDAEALRAVSCALADAVLATGLSRGDPAWAGLVALIGRDRQPVWVSGMAGDSALLLRLGARPVPPGGVSAAALLAPRPSREARALLRADPPARGFAETQAAFGSPGLAGPVPRGVPLRVVAGTTRDAPEQAPAFAAPTFFDLFTERLAVLLRHGPLGAGPIAEVTGLVRAQADAWLLRAEAEGTVRFDRETGLYALR